MIKYQYLNSKLLFVGINPHEGSFNRGVPFSNNKMFWYLLSRAGIISETIEELRDDQKLKKIYDEKFNHIYKLGLVNMIDRPTNDVSLLKKGEEVPGIKNVDSITGCISHELYVSLARLPIKSSQELKIFHLAGNLTFIILRFMSCISL